MSKSNNRQTDDVRRGGYWGLLFIVVIFVLVLMAV